MTIKRSAKTGENFNTFQRGGGDFAGWQKYIPLCLPHAKSFAYLKLRMNIYIYIQGGYETGAGTYKHIYFNATIQGFKLVLKLSYFFFIKALRMFLRMSWKKKTNGINTEIVFSIIYQNIKVIMLADIFWGIKYVASRVTTRKYLT